MVNPTDHSSNPIIHVENADEDSSTTSKTTSASGCTIEHIDLSKMGFDGQRFGYCAVHRNSEGKLIGFATLIKFTLPNGERAHMTVFKGATGKFYDSLTHAEQQKQVEFMSQFHEEEAFENHLTVAHTLLDYLESQGPDAGNKSPSSQLGFMRGTLSRMFTDKPNKQLSTDDILRLFSAKSTTILCKNSPGLFLGEHTQLSIGVHSDHSIRYGNVKESLFRIFNSDFITLSHSNHNKKHRTSTHHFDPSDMKLYTKKGDTQRDDHIITLEDNDDDERESDLGSDEGSMVTAITDISARDPIETISDLHAKPWPSGDKIAGRLQPITSPDEHIKAAAACFGKYVRDNPPKASEETFNAVRKDEEGSLDSHSPRSSVDESVPPLVDSNTNFDELD